MIQRIQTFFVNNRNGIFNRFFFLAYNFSLLGLMVPAILKSYMFLQVY